MPLPVLKRPQAERDIEECFVYIAEDNVDIAVEFLAAVEASVEQLGEFPMMGKSREFQNKQLRSVRMWHVKGFENYLIFYMATVTAIEIIRVLHSSRDIEDLFS